MKEPVQSAEGKMQKLSAGVSLSGWLANWLPTPTGSLAWKAWKAWYGKLGSEDFN